MLGVISPMSRNQTFFIPESSDIPWRGKTKKDCQPPGKLGRKGFELKMQRLPCVGSYFTNVKESKLFSVAQNSKFCREKK